MFDIGITDEETAAEERNELLSRVQGSLSPTSHRKPRLKRSSKSQISVPQHKSLLAATAAGSDFRGNPEFNFTRTPRETLGKSGPIHARTSKGDTDAQATTATIWSERMGGLSRGEATSPTDDIETSELDHSSDADAEQATEESDPDPYEDSVRTVLMGKGRR
jgi:hypothetical protein